VMDPTVQYIGDIKALKETDLYRVRGVEGVDWAVPMYYGTIQARLHNGVIQTCILIGVDDATLIGAPPIMVQGKPIDLRIDGGVIVDQVGAATKLSTDSKKYGHIPLQIGDRMELNDNRAVVVGVCSVSRTFQSQPVLYTTYSQATLWVPSQRKLLSFVLAHSKPGSDPDVVAQNITATTGLAAYSKHQLQALTLRYYMRYTGIFVNFGVAIILGFIIGTAIAGQTLYNFTMDNLAYFGIFKAMGADNALLAKMVLLQALFVSGIGWGIGMGATALFGLLSANSEISFCMPLWLYISSAFSILLISTATAFVSIRRVVYVDPAIVFRGG
ncbi:MAG: ABC transporter permease, partial [Verrucomicrobia bacterium]|nr:ABC transporter permease [Verrucomicrobiota bacterium]